MALKYRLVQRGNPSKPTDPKKYYANVVTRGDVSLRELSKELAQISTVSIADVMATIEALLEIIPRHLMQGEIVRLGEFGSFSVTISSEGAPTPEDFTSAQIKSLNLNFRPGKELNQMMAAVHFEKEQSA
jgi:predicted histone-like DNA-binding protein